ncbi:MAG: glycosyltransferase family 4 protein [bacterium]|nr:glycosyltransferase family 4 protein [bacterium]
MSERCNLEIVSTLRPDQPDRGMILRVSFGAWLGMTTIVRILRSGASLVDVHAVSGRDLLKHSAVLIGAKLVGRPSILRIHGGDFDPVYATSGSTAKRLIRWILRMPSRVVLLSDRWAETVRQIEPRTHTFVLPNAVDCDELAAIAEERPAEANSALMLGNLCERKGHFDALEALAAARKQHPSMELLLAGAERDEGAMAELEERARELGIEGSVHFLGPVFDQEKRSALKRAGIFLLPSHVENMPVSVMEAMGAGLPVIGSRVGAVPEMIEDGVTGFLMEARDRSSLKQRWIELLERPELRREMGMRGRDRAQQLWSRNLVGSRTADLYDELQPAG